MKLVNDNVPTGKNADMSEFGFMDYRIAINPKSMGPICY